MCAGALDDPVQRVGEHEAELSGVAVQCVDLWPPVQVGLKGEHRDEKWSELTRTGGRFRAQTTPPQTHISDYSVQRVDQDKVKGGGGG